MFNLRENELLMMLDAMASVIAKFDNLPNDCPEIKDSRVFKEIEGKIKELVKYMNQRTETMDKKTSETNIQVSLRAMPNNKNRFN